MDQRVRFEEQETTTDPVYGPQPGSWVEVVTVWANVQDELPSRSEAAAGGIRIAAMPARLRVRYRAGITSAMRVVLVDRGDRVMQIIAGPVELGRREGLEMKIQEYSTAGDAP